MAEGSFAQLRTGPWVHFAEVEGGARVSQGNANFRCERVRVPHYAPRDPFYVPEDLHGLADIVVSTARD